MTDSNKSPRNRHRFTAHEIRQLEANPNVLHVSEMAITYSPEFKLAALESYRMGNSPQQIFIEAGFLLSTIGNRKPQECLKRWRATYSEYGEKGLLEERRGKAATGRKSTQDLSVQEQLERAEARIKLLEAEKRFLKKARGSRKAGEAEQELSASAYFELINQTIRLHQITGMTSYLCGLVGVSRSGYYRWLNAEEKRQHREFSDEKDLDLIKHHFNKLKCKAGALVIKMHLEQNDHVTMNHKKIRRIMEKYGLRAKVRQANPYRRLAKATQEHKTCPNLLKRHFDQGEPEKVLLTDITYIPYGNGQTAYLSCVKDGATKQILAHHTSKSLEMPIVERTLDKLFDRLNGIHPEAILHSDQGMHYTHPSFQKRVQAAGIKQSMSRKGNCWDNAPMESFFGHMKDELDDTATLTFEELCDLLEDYIHFYNSCRYQWDLKKMTPDEYRSHLLAA
ncbi:IS3 family transposase [Paenibacillus chartarius]|uniref:IS3 family transposase n=1 Tax=Paenibacillus chartarius TaxID=747481 RepID=A0ABV6DRI5_9BACL